MTKREETDKKIEMLIKDKYYKQTELANLLGISYMTLYNRRRDKNWSGKEISIIESL